MVNLPGRRSCTGTLLIANGTCAILCSNIDFPTLAIASRASALFYCDGGSRPTVVAELVPEVLFAQMPKYSLVLVAVDQEPLVASKLCPLLPSPEVLPDLAKNLTHVGTGPELHVVVHLYARPKALLSFYLDDYDARTHRIYFQTPGAPIESHGAPVFYGSHWVGVVVEQSERSSERTTDSMEFPPLYARNAEHGVGIACVLEDYSVLGGINTGNLSKLEREPLVTTFLQPRLATCPFDGKASFDVFDAAGGLDLAAHGLCLSNSDIRQDEKGKHHLPTLAIKAVYEANVSALSDLVDRCGHNFLADVRVANGWSLAHVCASAATNGTMLLPLEGLGVPLDARSTLGDTVAHVAAYHGNLGALRILFTRDAPIDDKNSAGERPVHKALQRRHDDLVSWFRNKGIDIPDLCEEVVT
ncbi:hypothetical protein CTAYLR_002029 [Chrysophaeum taylorii]|uniref:Uncharacterized protein n=1 Tax=Chrysophaeum taylorii TaxID=2483200 RepID=A0AAD7XR95_9STRA|nr:hypothetical protein CTAYLR_002029 [Chrysophaeum taylorii]